MQRLIIASMFTIVILLNSGCRTTNYSVTRPVDTALEADIDFSLEDSGNLSAWNNTGKDVPFMNRINNKNKKIFIYSYSK